MSPSSEKYQLLLSKIDEFIRKYYLHKLLRGLLFCGSGILAGYLFIAAIEYWGHFNTIIRTILFYSYILINLSLLLWLVVPNLMAYYSLGNRISYDQAATIIGEHFRDIGDKLLNTLQLKKLADTQPEHWAIIEAGINQKIEKLKPVSFPSAINIRENLKHIKWLAIPFLVIVIWALMVPANLLDSTNRLLKHNQYFAPRSPFQFNILNQKLEVIQGDDFKLSLKLSGNSFPENIYLESGKNTFKLEKENLANFHYTFNNVQQSMRFVLKGGDFSSMSYELHVKPKPSLLKFDVELQYPAYLKRTNDRIENAGDLTVPEGTEASWKLYTENTQNVLFVVGDQKKTISSKNNLFMHQEVLRSSGSYYLKPLNQSVQSADSARYQVHVIPDLFPDIQVEEKPDSLSSKAMYFQGNIRDDHGFSKLNFYYKIVGADGRYSPSSYRAQAIKISPHQTENTFFYFWDLKAVQTQPGEQISYYFEVADNDGVNGPKRTKTPEKTLYIPNETAINKQLGENSEAIKQKMQSAIGLSKQLDQDSKKAFESLLDKKTLNFEEKSEVNALLKKQQDLEKLVEEIKKDNQANKLAREELQQQSPDLLAKQKQMEVLFNQVFDEKTKELLKKLEELLQQNNKELTQSQLSKMQMDNKSLNKELDRMLELYKQLEFEQKLNEQINALEKLSADQQKLAEQTKNSQDNQTLEKNQQKLKNDFKSFKEEMKQLEEKNAQLEQKNAFERDIKSQEKIDQEMDKSLENLQQKKQKDAEQAQQQAADQLKNLTEQLKKMAQDQEESNNQLNIGQLREILKNLLNSSFAQEKLMSDLQNMHTSDPRYVNLVREQKNIKDNLSNTSDSLYALSKRAPQIQAVVNQEVSAINTNIDQALESLSERFSSQARQSQQYAMTSMNNLALLLNESLQQLQNQKGGSSKSRKTSLSKLNQMQQQLNRNMQKMREELQRGNMGKDIPKSLSEQLTKLARDQQIIRQSLQEYNIQQNKDGQMKLGELEKIAKQMEQTEKDIVNKHIFDETLKRQRDIQTKMLEAEKAEQQQQLDEQVESKAGRDLPPGYQKALQQYEKLRLPQVEQLRTVPPALNYYYKLKIKTYFNQLKMNSDGRN